MKSTSDSQRLAAPERMLHSKVRETARMDEERQERIRYYTFAAFVGALLLLNVTGIWKTVFGIDTAVIVTLLAGYKTFYNSISSLLEKRISADIALCIAVIAALTVGEYLAAAEAMFIVLVGEGLESYAAGRTEAAIMKFVARRYRRRPRRRAHRGRRHRRARLLFHR
jgi:cation transport ATPase